MTGDHELRRFPIKRGDILLVATSSDKLSSSGNETGAWLPEVAVPYCKFVSNGYDVTIASPQGGKIPVDPASVDSVQGEDADMVKTFLANETASQMMAQSVPLSKVESTEPYRVLFFAGGHGASNDFPSNHDVQRLLKQALQTGVVVGAVCHGNAALASEEMGKMLSGRKVSVFSDAEEQSLGKEAEVPFLLESRLKELGLHVHNGGVGQESVVVDGNLITGQNPASSARVAAEILSMLDSSAPDAPPVSPRAHVPPGTFTAAEVPEVLHVTPILPTTAGTGSGTGTGTDVTSGTGVGTTMNPDSDTMKDMTTEDEGGMVTEPYMDNLGPNTQPSPGTYTDNDAPAGA